MWCAIEHCGLLLGSTIVPTSCRTSAFALLSMCVRFVLREISSLNSCWGPGQLDATLPSEEAVLTGQERCNAARKRPTAVKRGVLRARAEASAAAAAAHATACSAALAAACSAHEDVQRQRQVRGGTHSKMAPFCSSAPLHSVRSLAQTAATDEDGKKPISNPHVFSQVSIRWLSNRPGAALLPMNAPTEARHSVTCTVLHGCAGAGARPGSRRVGAAAAESAAVLGSSHCGVSSSRSSPHLHRDRLSPELATTAGTGRATAEDSRSRRACQLPQHRY